MSIVPKFSESQWAGARRSRTVADAEWPRIGIYCSAPSHESAPWLSGSFEVSPELLNARGTIHWGWRDIFVTGDGFSIDLAAGARAQIDHEGGDASARGIRELVDDEPYIKSANLDQAKAAFEAGRFEDAEALNADDDAKQARVRSNIKPECGRCGDRLVLRGEKVQPVLTTLWSAGVLEISIASFRSAYRRAR